MNDLIFFVAWETASRSRITAIAFSGSKAAELLKAHPGATVRVKKAMPCAPRRVGTDARIAAPFPVGQSPVPAGKE